MSNLHAIIVPTVRPGGMLDVATMVADELNAHLLVVRGLGIADARNRGLDVARAAGWRRVLFLDDDIEVDAGQADGLVSLLGDRPVAACAATDFPDRSVVRHADPDPPPVQPGGSCMAVDMRWPQGRFPRVYNEDWFFMWPHAQDGGVAHGGEVRQLPYDPFADPARARREEFGDLVAEALYRGEFDWARAVDDRRALHLRVLAAHAPGSAPHRAVSAGLDALGHITPDDVRAFMAAGWAGAG